MAFTGTLEKCKVCEKTVYFLEMISADGVNYHKNCFTCSQCNGKLTVFFFFGFLAHFLKQTNIDIHVFMFVCIMYVRTYICMYVYLCAYYTVCITCYVLDEHLLIIGRSTILQASFWAKVQGEGRST